jgi:hypothetical protein
MRPNRRIALALSLVLVVALAGCAGKDTAKGLLAVGQVELTASSTFANAAHMVYFPNCLPAARAGFEQFCPAFKAFSVKFDKNYPLAVQTWQIAFRANDTAALQGAEATIIQLVTELSALTASVLIQGGK